VLTTNKKNRVKKGYLTIIEDRLLQSLYKNWHLLFVRNYQTGLSVTARDFILSKVKCWMHDSHIKLTFNKFGLKVNRKRLNIENDRNPLDYVQKSRIDLC
jgi:hypothetical protein